MTQRRYIGSHSKKIRQYNGFIKAKVMRICEKCRRKCFILLSVSFHIIYTMAGYYITVLKKSTEFHFKLL